MPPSSWTNCSVTHSREPVDETVAPIPPGVHPCCVHVKRIAEPTGPAVKSFGCCWCHNIAVHPGETVPPLSSSARRVASHGPKFRHCAPARPEDLTLA